MNSSVKQAQKDGATVADIFAGLAISVVKNALYKVIRSTDASLLGDHIVVQGGTFLNDAVLRAFEMELKTEVVRPAQAGLMGAYGSALHAREEHHRAPRCRTTLTAEQLKSFTHKSRTLHCKGCTNACLLTINTFDHDRRLVSGNNCDRIVDPASFINDPENLNLYAFKQQYLASFKGKKGKRGRIGLPLQLSFYEQLLLAHLLHHPRLRGGRLPTLLLGALPERTIDHQQRYRLLPRQVDARPIDALLKEGSIRSSTLCQLQHQ